MRLLALRALRVLAGGRAGVERCVADEIGLSAGCAPCWVDNVMCDQRACLFTCLWSLARGEKNNRDAAPDQLSTCLKCDEVMCGPAFITCAGANRRRCGITSDITRAAAEVCNLTLAV